MSHLPFASRYGLNCSGERDTVRLAAEEEERRAIAKLDGVKL